MYNVKENTSENFSLDIDRFISTLTSEYEIYIDGYCITADLDSFTHSMSLDSIDLFSIV